MFPKPAKTTTNAGEKTPANVSKKRQNDNKRRRKNSRKCFPNQPTLALQVLAAELARKVHWTFRLSKLTLRVAFARYALCAKAGRRAEESKSRTKDIVEGWFGVRNRRKNAGGAEIKSVEPDLDSASEGKHYDNRQQCSNN